jgi:hypothetical protein
MIVLGDKKGRIIVMISECLRHTKYPDRFRFHVTKWQKFADGKDGSSGDD